MYDSRQAVHIDAPGRTLSERTEERQAAGGNSSGDPIGKVHSPLQQFTPMQNLLPEEQEPCGDLSPV